VYEKRLFGWHMRAVPGGTELLLFLSPHSIAGQADSTEAPSATTVLISKMTSAEGSGQTVIDPAASANASLPVMSAGG
jgi:hypothetical protein